MLASFVAELYTDPAFLFLVAGFALLAVANLARASPRFVARATTTIVVCGPTLRLLQALVCSPAELARDVDSLAEGRLGFLTVCVAGGATFGVQPLPTTRKLLAAGYLACAVACSTVGFRVRTGDDRMPSLELLHGVLPFLASFLAALAVSGPSLRQDDSSAPLPLSPPTPPLSAPAACSAGALARAPEVRPPLARAPSPDAKSGRAGGGESLCEQHSWESDTTASAEGEAAAAGAGLERAWSRRRVFWSASRRSSWCGRAGRARRRRLPSQLPSRRSYPRGSGTGLGTRRRDDAVKREEGTRRLLLETSTSP